jgi:hypothetical protein
MGFAVENWFEVWKRDDIMAAMLAVRGLECYQFHEERNCTTGRMASLSSLS